MTPSRTALLFALVLLPLAGCREQGPAQTAPGTAPGAEPRIVLVREAFVTSARREDEIDSVAAWAHPEGDTWVIATAKASQRLLVFDGDSGEFLQAIGGRGTGPGEFNRPNGIAVHGDLLFVAERDNGRIQMFDLPGFEPRGSFGEGDLIAPYGLWLMPLADGGLDVFVTDSYLADVRTLTVPPLAELDRRVRRYRLDPTDPMPRARLMQTFGDTTPQGALRMVESIAGDPAHDRLLIAEEDLRVGTTLREYTLDGRFTGRNLPPDTFEAQAEGVALYACPDGHGYWITADQHGDLTQFLVFERASLAYLGRFHGEHTAATDGVAMHMAPTRRFPDGVFYASHDDEGVTAFDWREIAQALGLRARCDELHPQQGHAG